MNIILENEVTDQIADKYILLELDTFLRTTNGQRVKSFAVVSKDDIVLQEIPVMEMNQKLHENLMKNYKKGDFNFCSQAIAALQGKWKGEIDSFYAILGSRIKQLEIDKPEDWDHAIPTPQ